MIAKLLAVLVAAFALSAVASGDYVAEREAAVALARAGKHEEALSAFVALAESAELDFQKADALEQAALSAARLDRRECALELAGQIPLEAESKVARMSILDGARRWRELAEEFADEEFAQWPEYLIGRAYLMRGRAFYHVGEGEAAQADLEKAARFPADHVETGVLYRLRGDNYSGRVGDEERAVEMYRSVPGPPGTRWGARIEMARILSRRGQHEEAVETIRAVLEDERVEGIPSWHTRLLCALGDALEALGDKEEAAAAWRRALQVEGIPSDIRAACEQRLEALDP